MIKTEYKVNSVADLNEIAKKIILDFSENTSLVFLRGVFSYEKSNFFAGEISIFIYCIFAKLK